MLLLQNSEKSIKFLKKYNFYIIYAVNELPLKFNFELLKILNKNLYKIKKIKKGFLFFYFIRKLIKNKFSSKLELSFFNNLNDIYNSFIGTFCIIGFNNVSIFLELCAFFKKDIKNINLFFVLQNDTFLNKQNLIHFMDSNNKVSFYKQIFSIIYLYKEFLKKMYIYIYIYIQKFIYNIIFFFI